MVKVPKPCPELSEERDYLAEVTERLRDLLADELLGVYAGGSYSFCDYRPGRSDLDVAAVVSNGMPSTLKRSVAERMSASSLPCPARGLELVVYRLSTARSTGAEPDFEVNLNTGDGLPELFEEGPGVDPGFWFPIDRDMLRQQGVVLSGPPAGSVFAAVQPRALLPLLAEAVAWQRRGASREDAVLNACRALRYAREGRWSSKSTAGEWAIEQAELPAKVVRAALASRQGAAVRVDNDAEPALAAAQRVLSEAASASRPSPGA